MKRRLQGREMREDGRCGSEEVRGEERRELCSDHACGMQHGILFFSAFQWSLGFEDTILIRVLQRDEREHPAQDRRRLTEEERPAGESLLTH